MTATVLLITDDYRRARRLRQALAGAPPVSLIVLRPDHLDRDLAACRLRTVNAIALDGVCARGGLMERMVARFPNTPVLALDTSPVGDQESWRPGTGATEHAALSVRQFVDNQRLKNLLCSERRLNADILNEIADAVVITDEQGRVSAMNGAARDISGWTEDEALGLPLDTVVTLVERETGGRESRLLRRVLREGLEVARNCRYALVRRNGTECPVEFTARALCTGDGEQVVAAVFRSMPLSRETAEHMAYLAQHDYLTGLPNRLLLRDRIGQAIAVAQRGDFSLTVFFLDLDGFKQINDSLGHEAGDQLLRAVSARLTDCVRSTDTVSRIGGDEFVILAMGTPSHGRPSTLIAEKIIDAISTPFPIGQRSVRVGISIGISVCPGDGCDADTLIRLADTAMYRAKRQAPNRYQRFSELPDTGASARPCPGCRRQQETDPHCCASEQMVFPQHQRQSDQQD